VLPAEFDPAVPASEGPQTHALGRAATGIGKCHVAALITIVYENVVTYQQYEFT
jgi:hypothetical protein